MKPLVAPGPELTAAQIRRYSRQAILPELGLTGQRRLAAARVLCVGAGGLGSPVLLYLAAAGVGTIGIVDFDVVEESNLQRQVIHGTGDVGRPKVESARAAIEARNPDVRVRVHSTRLESANALAILADYDLVIDGTDNFATRYLVNDACVLLGRPYVWASIFRFDGQTSVFWAGHGPCYRCVFPRPPDPGSVPSCAEGGVLGVLCASLGAIQATEALKLIAGMGDPLVGRLLTYDALGLEFREVSVRADPGCAACGTSPTITGLIDYDAFCGGGPVVPAGGAATVSVEELAVWLAQRDRGERDFLLVDVREPGEREIVDIPGSVLVPLGRFRDGTAPGELPHDRPIVLYCKVGARSAQALAVLRGAGIDDAVHVDGGVLAWVERVDPARPTY